MSAERRPDQPPREVPCECDPNALSTGTCKPDGAGHLKEYRSWTVETRLIEGEPLWEGLVDLKDPPFRGHRTEVAGIVAH